MALINNRVLKEDGVLFFKGQLWVDPRTLYSDLGVLKLFFASLGKRGLGIQVVEQMMCCLRMVDLVTDFTTVVAS